MNYLVVRATFPSTIVHKVIEASRTGEPTETWGNGQQIRPFLYIECALENVYAAMTTEGYWGPANIAADEIVTVNSVPTGSVRSPVSNPTTSIDRTSHQACWHEVPKTPSSRSTTPTGITSRRVKGFAKLNDYMATNDTEYSS
jgi:hypothetical protein